MSHTPSYSIQCFLYQLPNEAAADFNQVTKDLQFVINIEQNKYNVLVNNKIMSKVITIRTLTINR